MRYEPDISRDTYSPARRHILPNNAQTERVYIRIGVENNGGGAAERCDAKLRLLEGTVVVEASPSLEPKILLWDTEERYEDIGVGNFAMLNIVFSHHPPITDGCNANIIKLAFGSTPFNMNPLDVQQPRIEDGFSVGRFSFEVLVRGKSGQSVRGVFILDVHQNWNDITMRLNNT